MPLWESWLLFAISGFAVWAAGGRLSLATDVLTCRYDLGQDLGGLVFLAITTNLPEIAIIVAAAVRGNIDLATGNILGGIAVQTVVLVVLDALAVPDVPLTHQAASLGLVLEGTLVVAVLSVALMGTRMSPSLLIGGLTPAGIAILALWLAGLVLVDRSRDSLPWQDSGTPVDAQPRTGWSARRRTRQLERLEPHLGRTWFVLAAAAVVTLLAGVGLEVTGSAIAHDLGWRGAVFGATVLAAVTALPEISTGIASLELGDYRIAVSDIFGGNAFLPVLFPLGTIVSGRAVLPHAGGVDQYLAALGILLTSVYIVGLIFRPQRQFLRLGPDSIVVLVLYVFGVLGLLFLK